MDIADWRIKIDELDRRLVELLNERAQAAHEIGKLKRNTSMPIYEPEREKKIFENVQRANHGAAAGKRAAAGLRKNYRRDAEHPEE